MTSISVTGPWVLRRSPSLQEPGEDGRSLVNRPGEVTGYFTLRGAHGTSHIAYLKFIEHSALGTLLHTTQNMFHSAWSTEHYYTQSTLYKPYST